MMAKSKNQLSFNDMLAELKAKKPVPVKVESRTEFKYFLIVSEGERTEPEYFKFLARKLPKHLVEYVEIQGTGLNTIGVVREAIKYRKLREKNILLPPFDEVWAVFDKDDFPDKNFNNAILLAHKEKIECGYSNESFELWYVLHYEYLQSALKRTDYIKKLSNYLGVRYEKKKPELAERIHKEGDVEKAMMRARKLEAIHGEKTDSQSCPSTRVYILVDRLLSFIDNKAPKF